MALRRLMNINNVFLSSMNKSWLFQFTTTFVFRGASTRFFCLKLEKSNFAPDKENFTLVTRLEELGVDVRMVRQRQPGVLRKMITNEGGLKSFLDAKGATKETIASIISRYPRSITRSYRILEERWKIWRNILTNDLEILNILKRSPESFFRSGNNENLQENIVFFRSFGLSSEDLCKMLTRAPRIFSNSVELNKQMINLLCEICLSLGGENPDYFVKQLISKNVFVFLRSCKQVKANVHLLQSSFKLDNEELLALLHGQGGDVLDLSNEYLKKTLANLKEKLLFHGCSEEEVNMFVLKHIRVLYLSPQNLNEKIDYLILANIDIGQILKCPLVLDKSISTTYHRIQELERVNYDFGFNGIGILALSQQRFELKLEKLHSTQ
ncbi:transcription termination factor 1, mitochondrial [Paroedura picta]|uniref:transcription termination factor 1, mitochondrial n=1 Tax=Paroedura picta TaxID=143630 RepID=UPI004057C215